VVHHRRALVIGAALVPLIRPIQFSIEFTGGSQFTVNQVANPDQTAATAAVQSVVPGATTKVTTIGSDALRIQTDQMTNTDTQASPRPWQKFGVQESDVSSSFIGPSWGQDVTRQSLWGLAIFLALTFVILAIYFRTWKMSVAAIIGLVDVLVITVGVYALFGFEISPAAVIGFLTILSYSLYDTTVVFDKIREHRDDGEKSGRTFGESVNLAVNQTLIRSINTTVVAALPTGAILFIGALWLGAQTLTDISCRSSSERSSPHTRRCSSLPRCTRCCARTSRTSRRATRAFSLRASAPRRRVSRTRSARA
jgi:preprotein translocase subunit SecF